MNNKQYKKISKEILKLIDGEELRLYDEVNGSYDIVAVDDKTLIVVNGSDIFEISKLDFVNKFLKKYESKIL